jgi:tetratricopeptide (TPR) repeat protein
MRSRVAAILTRLGYTPVFQEIFGTESGDLRQVICNKIDACEGLIQIVGQGYGAEPPTVDAEYGRVSYTQFEFLYARSQKKKTWLIFAGDACSRDTPLERLDLPSDHAHPDPAGYQAERRALQVTYRNLRRKDGHLYHPAANDIDLELKIERLRDELAELRVAFKLWQNRVLHALVIGFVFLALVAGSVWWFGFSQHKEIQGISAEARHITKEKIRSQLLEAAERTRQTALADAEKAKDWKERDPLKQAAEKAYTDQMSRIDELASSFAEIEGTNRSTKVFDEMTRILAEQGVDEALAYASTQRAGILEKAKARATAAREKNQADLLPLLKSAQLHANRSQFAEAESLFADILQVEPDWPDARNAFTFFLVQQGVVIEPAEATVKLKKAVKICRETLGLDELKKSPRDWAQTQNILGDALQALGTRSGAGEESKLLEEAVAAYRSSLEIYTKADLPRDWAATQNNLGIALRALGARSGGEEGRKLLEEAVAAYRSALEIRTKADLPQDWAVTQNNLGVTLQALGARRGSEEGRKLLEEAVAAYRSALEIYTKADLPQDWAATQNNLGNALQALGTRSGGEEGRKLLEEAVAAYRSALEIYTKPDRPQDWATTQNNLGIALRTLGARKGGEEGRKLLEDAVAAYRSALEIYTKADLPQDWAQTQNNLGLALRALGARRGGEEGRKLLEDAVAAYRSALEIYTKADLPQDWAQTQNNLGLALDTLGHQLEGEEGLKQIGEAVESFCIVRSIRDNDLSRFWLANELGVFAFKLILNGQFAEAESRCEEAQSLADEIGDGAPKTDRDDLIFVKGNLAHALLFEGHYDEALSIYRQYWDKPLFGRTFGQVTLDDFAAFDKAGLIHPDLSRMRQALTALQANASNP